MVVAQLAERLLPISEVHGSSPVNSQNFVMNISIDNCRKDENK